MKSYLKRGGKSGIFVTLEIIGNKYVLIPKELPEVVVGRIADGEIV